MKKHLSRALILFFTLFSCMPAVPSDVDNTIIGNDISNSDCLLSDLSDSLGLARFISIDISNVELETYQEVDSSFFNKYLENRAGFNEYTEWTELCYHSFIPTTCSIVLIENDLRFNSIRAYLLKFEDSTLSWRTDIAEYTVGGGAVFLKRSLMLSDSTLKVNSVTSSFVKYNESNSEYLSSIDSVTSYLGLSKSEVNILSTDTIHSLLWREVQ